jgi:hypothetical protein
MKRTIFLNGRRRTLRALVFGAAVALLSVPVAQGDPGYNFDNKVKVIPYLSQGLLVGPGLAHDMDESVICNASGCLQRSDVAVASDGIVVATGQDAADRLMAEPLSRLSGTGSEAPAAKASGIEWSETAIWLAVGLAGALGLLGLGLVANRSRVRMAHS